MIQSRTLPGEGDTSATTTLADLSTILNIDTIGAMPRPPGFTFVQSLAAAVAGIRFAIRDQRNFRTHLWIGSVIVLLAISFQVSWIEWCILIGTTGGVLAVELLNTAIETVVDLASPEHHELAGRAKDVAAGAVLVSAVAALAIGLIIFGERLCRLALTWLTLIFSLME